MSEPKPTSYWNYIRVDELLDLQGGLPPEAGHESADQIDHEEVLFITVHQVFELWFKLVFGDLRAARDLFKAERVEEQQLAGVVARLRRMTTILRVAASHFEVMETLGTRDYLEFRTKLMPASGFQSAQMRCIEILFGIEDTDRIGEGDAGDPMKALLEADGSKSPAYLKVEAQLADGPNFRECLHAWLARTPINGVEASDERAQEQLEAFIESYLAAHSAEVDICARHAHALTDEPARAARIDQMYAQEKAAIAAFLRPEDAGIGPERVRARAAMLFIETFRDLPLLAWPREVLAEGIAFEQAFLIFRQRHARMVERVIGRRVGTGGSSGVDYLDATAMRYRVFRDLWAVRTMMIRPSATPEPLGADFYAFRSEPAQPG